LNNYTAVPLFGLIIGLNIDIGVIFNYELWIPFGILSITLFLIQYLSSFLSLIMLPLNSQEREIVIFGSFAKSELAMVTLLIALSYGVIGGDIFTLAIITMSIFNVIAWHKLKSANMEKN
jgi:Kef-type K+ transport system membrane component KefB